MTSRDSRMGAWVIQLTRPQPGAWLLTMLLVLFQAVSHLATPVFYKLVFDRVITGGEIDFLVIAGAGMGTVFLLMIAAEAGQGYLSADLAMRTLNALRKRLYVHLQRLPLDFFARAHTGDLLSRFTTDLAAIDRLFSVALYKVVLNGIVAVLCVTALFVVEWRLALFTVIVLPIIALLPRMLAARGATAAYQRRQDDGRFTGAMQEDIAAQRVIRAYGLEDHRHGAFDKLLNAVHRTGMRANLFNAYLEKSTNLGLILGQLLIVSVGAYLVARGFLTAGDLAAFFGLILNASGAAAALTAFLPDVVQASGSFRRIGEILSEPAMALEEDNGPPLEEIKEVRFKDVTFGYGSRLVLDGLSFTVSAGESVAFVGRSGSGKSTVLNLLLRFHEPTSGDITVNGRDIRAFSRKTLRSRIGSVFQHTDLFTLSVRENIRLGKLDALDADVDEAARAASIEDAILTLDQGYDTLLGEGGTRLSGGQSQRLAIARAVIRNADVLLLDEATSALDPATEAAVNATLEQVARGRIRIAVTHRLAAAALMDRIFVLENGRVAEDGTHNELLARGGIYTSMLAAQA